MGRITSLEQLEYAEDVTSFGSPVIIFVGPPSTGTGTSADGNTISPGVDNGVSAESNSGEWFGYGMPNVYVQYDLQEDGTYSIPGHFYIKNYTIIPPYTKDGFLGEPGISFFHLTSEQLNIPLTSTTAEKIITGDIILQKIFDYQSFCSIFRKNVTVDNQGAFIINDYHNVYSVLPYERTSYIYINGNVEVKTFVNEVEEIAIENQVSITVDHYAYNGYQQDLISDIIYSTKNKVKTTADLKISKIYYLRSPESTGLLTEAYGKGNQYNYNRVDSDIKIELPKDLGKVPAFTLPATFINKNIFQSILYGHEDGKIPYDGEIIIDENGYKFSNILYDHLIPVTGGDEIVSKLITTPEELSLYYSKETTYDDVFNFDNYVVGRVYYIRHVTYAGQFGNDYEYSRTRSDNITITLPIQFNSFSTTWQVNNVYFPEHNVYNELFYVSGNDEQNNPDPIVSEIDEELYQQYGNSYLNNVPVYKAVVAEVRFKHVKNEIPVPVIALSNDLIFYNDKICTANKIPVYPIYPKFSRGVNNIRWAKAAIMVAHLDDELILFQPLCELVAHIKVCMYPFNGNYNEIKSQVSYREKVSSIWSEINTDKYSQLTIDGFFDSSNLAARDEYFFNNDRLRNQIKTSILELKSQGVDTIITHSPWGDYGHTHHMWIFSYIHELAVENKLNVWCQPKYYTEQSVGNLQWWSSLIYSSAICVSPNYEFDETLTYNNAKIFHQVPIEGSSLDSWTWIDLNWEYTDPVANKQEILSSSIFPAGLGTEIYPFFTPEEYEDGQLVTHYPSDSASPFLMMICGTFDNTYQNVLDPANENYAAFKEHFSELAQVMTFSGGILFPTIVKNLLDTGNFVESPFLKYNSTSINLNIDEAETVTTISAEYIDFNTDNEITKDFTCTYEWTITGVTVIDEESVIKNQANLQFTTNDSETTVTLVRIAKHPVFGLYSKTITGYIN